MPKLHTHPSCEPAAATSSSHFGVPSSFRQRRRPLVLQPPRWPSLQSRFIAVAVVVSVSAVLIGQIHMTSGIFYNLNNSRSQLLLTYFLHMLSNFQGHLILQPLWTSYNLGSLKFSRKARVEKCPVANYDEVVSRNGHATAEALCCVTSLGISSRP